jgi:hypothetical protein
MGELVPYVHFRCVAIDLRLNELAERIWCAHEQIASGSRAQTQRHVLKTRAGGEPDPSTPAPASAGIAGRSVPKKTRTIIQAACNKNEFRTSLQRSRAETG